MCAVTMMMMMAVLPSQGRQKLVKYEALQKLAAESVREKQYAAKPSYEKSDGKLMYRFPADTILMGQEKADANTRFVVALMLVEKFRAYPPKRINKELEKKVISDAEMHVKKAYEFLNSKTIPRIEINRLLENMDDMVYKSITEGINKYAEENKLKPSALSETVLKDVVTDPKGGKVHCITVFEMKIMVMEGKKPEMEVMNYVLGDTIPFEGWVYYIVTWNEGKKKAGPSKMFIGGGKKVTFK